MEFMQSTKNRENRQIEKSKKIGRYKKILK